tara:strand:+ start:242 stop:1177 length:936 start_codon:yes stop_codon:yes gene_type:complete
MESNIKIFSGRNTISLAKDVAKSCNLELGKVSIVDFADGECEPSFDETVRGKEVYIVQSIVPPAENLMELLLMVDAAKRASAKSIVAVVPYFGYARQDKKGKPRVPIGAKLVSNLLSAAGVNRIMTMDLHADQIQGFFEVPVDHLFASTVFVPYIQSLGLDNLTIASPDIGGARMANAYARFLNAQVVICYKHREKPNEISKLMLIGDVKDKNVILVDDIVDTAGTISKSANMMIEQGAKSVRAICSHGVLSGNAIEKIENSKMLELIISDTIPQKQKVSKKVKVLTVSNLFGDVIQKVHSKESISSSFIC